MPEFADMASFMKFAFKEGGVVYLLTGGEKVLSVVLSVSCPMGYGAYVVMNLHNGETRTVTKMFLESAPEQLLGTNEADDFDNDNNEETLKLSSSRFKKCSEEDISHLQNASKSQKTHIMTRWGVKIFTGTFVYIHSFMLLPTDSPYIRCMCSCKLVDLTWSRYCNLFAL